MKLVTKDSFQTMLDDPRPEYVAAVIGRALVVVFNNQTKDEQRVNVTNKHNGIGFTGADAHSGCITAKYYLKHKTLLDWQVERWLKPSKSTGYARIAKYWAQLNTAAVEKAQRTA